jgi:tight adherence protein C
MNLELLLALGFGLGIAGMLGQLLSVQTSSLANRVGLKSTTVSEPTFEIKLRDFAASVSESLRSVGKSNGEKALFELPEILELLTVSLRTGDGIYRAFSTVIPRCEGDLARELSKVLTAVEYGAPLGQELRAVALSLPHPQIKEFVNKVSLSLERGAPLAKMLEQQALSARAEIRNRLLAQAGKNETKMLIPLVFLILPITVLFAIYPSLELLNFGFI